MKVKTMIEELQKANPEAEVRCGYKDGLPALFVNYIVDNDNVVWIESEEDIDLGEELEARYANAIEENMDELDFYMDLLEIGINVYTVRRYMGDEKANHMERFCREHGLI